MKRVFGCCALLPLVAFAGARDDYARQWPLALQDGDAGAYRAVLDREVYRSAQSPRHVELPWFPLPAGPAAQAQDLTVISERNPDGNVTRVEARVPAPARASGSTTTAWLVDASALHEGIVALEPAWTSPAGGMDVAYRVEGSDDLRSWRVLQPQAQLLDLVRDGRHLRQGRIPLEGSARYLRLLPNGAAAAPAIIGVRAELAPTAAGVSWKWETLPGRTVVDHGNTTYVYTLDGRFPVERADVAIPGNNAGEWTLQSRDADDAPWQTRAGPWVAYRVGMAQRDRSAAQVLAGVSRDRYWRLSSRTPVDAVPALRLGYRPEVMIFVAHGAAPYALVAGSGRAVRAQAPVPQLVDALRMQHDGDWQPANATLGPPAVLAGDAALAPAPARRDWTAWLLWSVLVAGALVVAAFASSLLRKPAAS